MQPVISKLGGLNRTDLGDSLLQLVIHILVITYLVLHVDQEPNLLRIVLPLVHLLFIMIFSFDLHGCDS